MVYSAQQLEGDLVREVEALYFDYATAIDENIMQWPDLFTDGAVYRATSRTIGRAGLPHVAIACEGKKAIRKLAMAIRESTAYLDGVMRHTATQVRITYRDEHLLKVLADFAVYESSESATRLFAVGRYQDVLISRGGGLRFQDKVCIYDGNLAISPILYPL